MNTLSAVHSLPLTQPPAASAAGKAREVREAFTQFVGETFYGHMLKSMRSTVGKPAYFHGGQAEETFRSQLDQQLAQELAQETGDRFAEPMFAQQFPHEARLLKQERASANHSFEELARLRRR